ncbi:Rieske (2Fe-2S) iron-sulfur domain protein [Segniliparus rotundus DSM 44985]|uniref:Cytochrome bc1 complex Rieske iron-sulfur subunit n=1 Tax=Segniliparus rotundus (strain ATCC BAA-972 / CDC 1076 / CIP 108378 / DSM 44985 / JCM 13578) TaxID=640132 RepID=D6ZF08_SEGRD|nr:ubiquinol-cytochrome c reductase iron-sulfur subunit [Segniliparus rotundus]ADG97532.1 Rieske (2Fe-2S) iron-sulfur domain protein [Segniliparus rotundus DSM 44985]
MSNESLTPDPTPEELSTMSRDELVTLGLAQDGVRLIHRQERWAVPGTRAEKRAERLVAFWLILGGLAAIALLAVFLFGHWEYAGPGESGYWAYTWETPLIGLTMGVSILAIGVAAIVYTKRFIPEEIAVQDRHDGGSKPLDKLTFGALLNDSLETSTLPRRTMIKRALIFSASVFGAAAGVFFIGGAIRNPWAKGNDSDLWHTGWTPRKGEEHETIYLRRYTPQDIYSVELVKPEDLASGGMETVFPWRESDGKGETEESRERLFESFHGIRNPVMLIRLRPEDAARVVKRKGQENFNFGEYYAYTKVCSHVGCPTSLYEQQTNRILCPCHQSQFDALHYAKPIFGPAARALAQLPITVNEEGYLIANGDYIEPVGPAFWERKS